MLTNPPDYEVVAITCAALGGGRWLTAHGPRLAELLHGSAWYCPDHADADGVAHHHLQVGPDDANLSEVPC